jgi:hypothetical protein
MATRDQIRDAMHRQPFRPFLVRLLDGRIFQIKHPDFISVSASDLGRDLVIHDDAAMHRIDLFHVIEVEEAASPAGSKTEGNGE